MGSRNLPVFNYDEGEFSSTGVGNAFLLASQAELGPKEVKFLHMMTLSDREIAHIASKARPPTNVFPLRRLAGVNFH